MSLIVDLEEEALILDARIADVSGFVQGPEYAFRTLEEKTLVAQQLGFMIAYRGALSARIKLARRDKDA